MGDHYFSSEPGAASRPSTVDLVLRDLHLKLRTDRGMFSPDKIDLGTRILLDSVPKPPQTGDLLDLGCGYGPIALTLAARAPSATVYGVDVNQRALALAAENAQTAGLNNVRFGLAEEIPADLSFAAIWSNPPIRIGKQQLHELLQAWLPRLTPDGKAHLVVQKHLGSDSLQRWLIDNGWPTTRLTSRSSYRILEVQAHER